MSGDDNFLARWSKRKQQAVKPAPEGANTPSGEDESVSAQLTGEDQDEAFDLSLLPDVEALTGDCDIQAFMHKAVPDALRNAALRKVWALDPSVRNYVGEALDYAWDWNTPGGVPGFGEVLSNEQSLEFVRNLLAGPESNENVIDEAGKRDKPRASSETPLRVSDQPEASAEMQDQVIENKEFNEPEKQHLETSAGAQEPLRRPRHGGALPS
jgi:hypothetical protein